MISATPYIAQSPTLSLHDIADRLWVHGEYEAYRALLAFIKERDVMLRELKEVNDNTSHS